MSSKPETTVNFTQSDTMAIPNVRITTIAGFKFHLFLTLRNLLQIIFRRYQTLNSYTTIMLPAQKWRDVDVQVDLGSRVIPPGHPSPTPARSF